MDKQQILKLINEMIAERQGLQDQFNLGAIEALKDLYFEINNR